jgi:Kef-type K+ transport system membrane component KefB
MVHIEHGDLVQFVLLLALIIATAKAAGWVNQRGGQPAVFGEIPAGVLLGPSLLARSASSWPPSACRPACWMTGGLRSW